MRTRKSSGCLRALLRWTVRGSLLLLTIAIFALGFLFRTALYERFVVFPNQARAWAEIRAERVAPTLDDGWNEYRGVMHSHSELSHDSAISFPNIVRALKKADVDFICMSDHYEAGKADYALGWNGPHDGILFIRGYELAHGFMPWGIPEGTVITRDEDPAALARRIHELGGVLFYAHCEEDRPWDLPELDGMEVYNIHPDFMEEDFRNLAPRILLSLGAYPDQAMRLMFDPPTKNLAQWDRLNATRHITGFAGNDAHQNVGIMGFYTEKDTLLLRGTGEKTEPSGEYKLNAFTRAALRTFSGPLEAGAPLFRFELDPYDRSCRFVNTHVLAKSCTEEDIIDSLRAGRAFIAFNMIADAKGFTCFALGNETKAVMGESIALEPGLTLEAAAPCPGRFTIVKDGKQVSQSEGRELHYPITEPGKYRVEVALDILGDWTPWIYANPIEVVGPDQQE